LVGGADASQNGLGALTPQNSMDKSGMCHQWVMPIVVHAPQRRYD